GDGKPGMPVSSNPLKGADIAAAFSGSGRSTPHHTNNRSAFVELVLAARELQQSGSRISFLGWWCSHGLGHST
ncbi:hypothetical protein, partial [Phyllobacterium sophorae]|uniref:hypothetical protein n=1 Tax=Phyllobacterium sophorae TaxID=1520277 RepID=UPI001AEC807D